jgi:trans-2,3-dihydro-3-hydroxyanthranilate isomerase
LARRYAVLDVFTEKALTGNPLAVVIDGEGLGDAAMQAIAAEFALSETVFVFPPERAGITANLRIFTPSAELPFAGHPTIGTAVLLATDRFGGIEGESDSVVVLAEKVGNVRCGVMVSSDGVGRAVFDFPVLPEERPAHTDVGLAASALGLDRNDICFENHVMSSFAVGGVQFVYVPIARRDLMARIRVDRAHWAGAFGDGDANVFVYTRDCVHQDGDVHARMFAPALGISEDPATGAAAVAFSGVVMRFDGASSGEQTLVIEQGYEMGRPSRIELELTVESGRLVGGRIGGSAVIIARGELFL